LSPGLVDEVKDILLDIVDVRTGRRGGCPGASSFPTVCARFLSGNVGVLIVLSLWRLMRSAAGTMGLFPGIGGGIGDTLAETEVDFRTGIRGGTVSTGGSKSDASDSEEGLPFREGSGEGVGEG